MELKAKFTEDGRAYGFISPCRRPPALLGVTRQTVLQRVKRGEIEAAHVTKDGGKRGLRIKVIERQPTPLQPPLISLGAVCEAASK